MRAVSLRALQEAQVQGACLEIQYHTRDGPETAPRTSSSLPPSPAAALISIADERPVRWRHPKVRNLHRRIQDRVLLRRRE